jgi:hypothetical protein
MVGDVQPGARKGAALLSGQSILLEIRAEEAIHHR